MSTPRVRAPELSGRRWLNTGGRDLTLRELRGRCVLLDFWTFCCVNCLHVLEELRPIEHRYRDVLVVIGVHSPKFAHERDPDAVAAAVLRHDVRHPVLDDPELVTWQRYTARAWPTLALIDPTGYVVASMAGEGHADGLARLIDELVDTHERQGTLRREADPYVPPAAPEAVLRFPGKAVPAPGGGLWVADSGNHRVVELAADARTVVREIGGGTGAGAAFADPQGLCPLPGEVADTVGYHLLVADAVDHTLRAVRLTDDGADNPVTTVAGTGRQLRPGGGADPGAGTDACEALSVDLSSPWDLAWYDGRVVIAMAGIHQLWWFDPVRGTAGVYAGTTVEALRDGPLPDVWLAQPSGLAVSADGGTLWIADSETSALRHVRDGVLRTAVGQGLFDFGHVDGPASEALLQHPLGVCALPDGSVLVADTYNGAVRRFDPTTRTVSTLADGLAEPSDIVLADDGSVLVVESAGHRLTRLAPGEPVGGRPAGGRTPSRGDGGVRHRTERPPTELAPGTVSLDVIFTPAPGQKLDETYGPSTLLEVSASPPELLLAGAGNGTGLSRRLTVNAEVASGVLQVVAQAATCDVDIEHAACHLVRQDWGVPVRVQPGGAVRLALVLRGLAD